MNTLRSTFKQPRLSAKAQSLATLGAIAGAVALPQLCHLMGWATGTGNAPGIALLPMHFPILLVGLLAGPVAGGVAGFLSPVVSFLLTGMPLWSNLPLMMVELALYGLVAGLLRQHRWPAIGKVALAQIAGRVGYAMALCLAIYAFGNPELSMASALSSTTAGLGGTLLQLALIPPIVKALRSN